MKHKEDRELSTNQYWQENIEAYGKFYDSTSEEEIIAPGLIGLLYRTFIFPLERRVTLDRYRKTVNYIEANVRPHMKVVDLGCGTGIFTTEILLKGANVLAVDYVESALSGTKRRVDEMLPDSKHNVEYLLLDIMEEPLPKSDIVIAIGVTPYVDSLEIFLDHVLPTTDEFYCYFLNKHHWTNELRNLLKFLNVRQYRFFDNHNIDEILPKYDFKRTSRECVGTGFLDVMQRID